MNTESSISRVATLNEQEILADQAFLQQLYTLANEQEQSHGDALDYARKCLDELAVHPEERYLDRVAKLARFIYTRSYEPTLDVEQDQLDRLRELAKGHPLVFLWSHKSHLDSFVFMRALYDGNFRPQPLSFAGINMAFTGFGTLAKRSGAIFLRRSFKDDAIYKLVFKYYIDYLVGARVPLSWSIEGTRSRTGKLMPPKLGLIQWVIESYRRASCDDVLLVPVSISFDQIAEMDDYVAMQQGLPKRKESLSWFIGYITGMKAKNGKIYLRFAEPVALSESAAVSESMFSKETSPDRIRLQKLAFEVSSRIENAMPITITDLVTMVLLGANDRALTEDQIRVHAQDIVALIHKRALPTAGDLMIDSGTELGSRLAAMSGTELIDCYSASGQPVYRIAPGKQLAAAYYRNTVIHYFLSSAIAELSIAALRGQAESEGALWSKVLELRDLLKFEFFFKTKEQFRADIVDYLDGRYADWRQALAGSRSAADALFTKSPPLFGHSIMRSFVEAYKVLSYVLAKIDGAGVTERNQEQLLKDCLSTGREMLLRKKIASESALSGPLFATAAKLADYRGLLSGDFDKLVGARKRFVDEIEEVVSATNILQDYYDRQQELTCDS